MLTFAAAAAVRLRAVALADHDGRSSDEAPLDAIANRPLGSARAAEITEIRANLQHPGCVWQARTGWEPAFPPSWTMSKASLRRAELLNRTDPTPPSRRATPGRSRKNQRNNGQTRGTALSSQAGRASYSTAKSAASARSFRIFSSCACVCCRHHSPCCPCANVGSAGFGDAVRHQCTNQCRHGFAAAARTHVATFLKLFRDFFENVRKDWLRSLKIALQLPS